MKKNYILGVFAVASLGLAACSQDEEIVNVEEPNQEEQVQPEFKLLTKYQPEIYMGNGEKNETVSRTKNDIDELYRPSQVYGLDYIYMLGLESATQPNELNIGEVLVPNYKTGKSAQVKKHMLTGSSYELYYALGSDIQDNSTSNKATSASKSGTIYLSQNPGADLSDCVAVKLSVFLSDDLQKAEGIKRIPLNKFAYEAKKAGVVTGDLKGSVIRYSSYDPQNVGDVVDYNDPSTRYISLPSFTDPTPSNMLTGKNGWQKNLVTECQDQYFYGSEFLVALDGDKLYLLREDPYLDEDQGGYYKVSEYDTNKTNENVGEPEMLLLSRITSIVNASFIFVDEDPNAKQYLVEDDPITTIANFKKQYGVDLTDLACPYAALDGVNSRFFINKPAGRQINSDTQARLILWAKGCPFTAVNGKKYDKLPEASTKINYDFGSQNQSSTRVGYGMEGQSFSVVFQGVENDLKGQNVMFWVTVDGVKLLMKAPLRGLALSKNVAQHIVVFVPANRFAKEVKTLKSGTVLSSRTNGEGYATFELPADCVTIQ